MTVASTLTKSSGSSYFDPSVVDSLLGIMSKADVRALLVDMERDVRLRLDRVAEINVTDVALPLIAQDAHDLKSMGGNFGLNELARCAGVVERAARSGCVDHVLAGMSPLISVGKHSLKELTTRPEFIGGEAS